MKCRFCAEWIEGQPAFCPHCGEATSAVPSSPRRSLAQMMPSLDQILSIFYVLAGLALLATPFLPALSFTVSPSDAPTEWQSTVTAPYLKSIVPLVLPLLGVAIVVMALPGLRSEATKVRPAAIVLAGIGTIAVAVWSAVALYRLGQAGVEAFLDRSFDRPMHLGFGLTAPWVVLAIGVAIVAAALSRTARRIPLILLLVLMMGAGGAAGAVLQPLQDVDELVATASTAVEGYEQQLEEEAALERARAREAAQQAEDAAIGNCAGLIMGWAIAMVEGRVTSNDVAFAIGTSNPVVSVIFRMYGSLYANAAREGYAAALGTVTNEAVDECRDRDIREASETAFPAPS